MTEFCSVPWSDREPGVRLAADLAAVDPAELSDAELVDVMAAWRRQASWAQAGELAAVAELAHRRERGSSRNAEFTSAEVGLTLGLSPRSADAHVDFALALADRLPMTRRHLAEGRIDFLKARVIAQGTAAVDARVAAAVERRVLPAAADQTPGRLRARVERAVMRLDPAGAERRREASEAERRVDCHDTGNGTAVLGGVHLPAGSAIAADDRLRAIARAIKAGGDPRTLDQLCADVFLSLLLGVRPATTTPAAACTTGSAVTRGDGDTADDRSEKFSSAGDSDRFRMPQAAPATMARAVGDRIGTVHLTVPLPTLLGLSTEPGEVSGYGPLTAEVARQMAGAASDPRTRWCVTVIGSNGEPLHHGHLGYRPPPGMAHVIRTLQPTCVFPGCGRPASACDLDHRVPYDQGGATCPCNMSPLCRRHHRAKQADGWRLAEHDARLRWTTPAGKTYELSPYPLGDEWPVPSVTERRSTGPPVLSAAVVGSLVENRWRKRIPGPEPLLRTRAGLLDRPVAAES
ncbi:DUF222 domain-containing protein [Actinoallomurus sp. NPDC052274]|uniref:HNH endonuclease signature motif containing protein n=1 Tax=Actinoallomurus sp. NPDC052274 TaxID=3155420 RepID=UPI0034393AAF